MGKVGYYIITAEQAAVLRALGISYETLGNMYCVRDWDAIISQIDDAVWADGIVDETEGGYIDTMAEYQDYMYWSTEGHFWS